MATRPQAAYAEASIRVLKGLEPVRLAESVENRGGTKGINAADYYGRTVSVAQIRSRLNEILKK